MAHVQTRLFESTTQFPKVPPDGTSLQEKMNGFLETLILGQVMDVQMPSPFYSVNDNITYYIGMVVYQEG